MNLQSESSKNEMIEFLKIYKKKEITYRIHFIMPNYEETIGWNNWKTFHKKIEMNFYLSEKFCEK